ncbi:MAG: acetyl-CoA carboxylase, biotin carboxyl carrier protein [Micavibrio sp. TMED27]|nr:acetyl-CoA carboxylase, biotin carboxyl carrier protein [Micavibrio sp.]OUT92492.1 MAG: acetyl-CoA carboxylase, biotin carboxyl carrier protein [Micavibrio sp. TMED27]|tara:strand:- start:158 stop:610 length:453 start_codon:yes stop_codon:yes gene_type:complete
MKIDSDAIKELATLLDDTGLNEIEVADGDQSIRVSKGAANVVAAPAVVPIAMASDPAIPQQASVSTDLVAHSHPGAVKSPMVGTAYLQPEPGAPSFVKKGDSVNAGDTLVIIEAMKVMNPIKAEKSGTVTQVLIEDAQPVEFGDVLLVIE